MYTCMYYWPGFPHPWWCPWGNWEQRWRRPSSGSQQWPPGQRAKGQSRQSGRIRGEVAPWNKRWSLTRGKWGRGKESRTTSSQSQRLTPHSVRSIALDEIPAHHQPEVISSRNCHSCQRQFQIDRYKLCPIDCASHYSLSTKWTGPCTLLYIEKLVKRKRFSLCLWTRGTSHIWIIIFPWGWFMWLHKEWKSKLIWDYLFKLPHRFGRGDHFITLKMFLGSVRWAKGDHVKSNKVVRCSAPSCLQWKKENRRLTWMSRNHLHMRCTRLFPVNPPPTPQQ